MDSYYPDETLIEDDSTVVTNRSYVWVKRLLVLFMIAVPVVIFVVVSSSLVFICLLAYINCLVIGFSTYHFLRKCTPASMVPVLFIPYLLLAWPGAILYFALFDYSNAYYKTMDRTVSYFDAGARVQLCVLLFLAGYYSIMFYLLRNEKHARASAIQNPKQLITMIGFLGMSVIFVNAISKVVKLPGFVEYLASGFFKYLSGLLFTIGALIKNISIVSRVVIVLFLLTAVLFYTVGNARAMAVMIILYFIVGLFFFSGISRKTKTILAILLIFTFPSYIVIANTTRILLGTVGFENFGRRLQALKEWRTVKIRNSTQDAFFRRLFFTGGHQIISRTPSEHPYLNFSIIDYTTEAAVSLIPGQIYYHPYYQGSYILPEYGIMVTDITSVEVSLIGNLWLLGGYMPVFIGGIMLGLLHGLVVRSLRKSWAVSGMKTFIYFSVFAPAILWAPNIDLISIFHGLVYLFILAWVIYFMVKLLIGDPEYYMNRTLMATEFVGEEAEG